MVVKFDGARSSAVLDPGVGDIDGVGLPAFGEGVTVVFDALFVSGVREGVTELFAFVTEELLPDEL